MKVTIDTGTVNAYGENGYATERGARDWSGFFAALSTFVTTVLPLVLPFLKAQQPPK